MYNVTLQLEFIVELPDHLEVSTVMLHGLTNLYVYMYSAVKSTMKLQVRKEAGLGVRFDVILR